MGLVGRGNAGGRGLKPHSDKTQVAIGVKEEALVVFRVCGRLVPYHLMVPEDRKVKL